MTHKNFRLTAQSFLIAALISVALIGKVEAAPMEPFKFEILPSEKCVLKKVAEEDTELRCMGIKKGEMQTVLDWCKKKSGAWTSDGKNGGTCRTKVSLAK